ncbi:hypothetical protein D5S17_09815 [Pseudonocardiaceae bacterium YIM PH 21723]|nr:hypothetical protein D5S17_09815 [Pseudonocardiaceae bacterium YIM PH 21723]
MAEPKYLPRSRRAIVPAALIGLLGVGAIVGASTPDAPPAKDPGATVSAQNVAAAKPLTTTSCTPKDQLTADADDDGDAAVNFHGGGGKGGKNKGKKNGGGQGKKQGQGKKNGGGGIDQQLQKQLIDQLSRAVIAGGLNGGGLFPGAGIAGAGIPAAGIAGAGIPVIPFSAGQNSAGKGATQATCK